MFLMHLMNVSDLPVSQYYPVRNKMFLKINIKKRTLLNFITLSHTVMSLYLDIMLGCREAKVRPYGLWCLAYRIYLQ